MVEKAYAAHRLLVEHHEVTPKEWVIDPESGRREQREGAKRAARTYVEALTGGFSHDALQTLVGGGKVRLLLRPEGKESAAIVNLYQIVCCRSVASASVGEREAFQTVFGPYANGAMQETS